MTHSSTKATRLSADEVERILGWRSDDFGHDTHALLEAESRALQVIGEDWLRLREALDITDLKMREIRLYVSQLEKPAVMNLLDAAIFKSSEALAISDERHVSQIVTDDQERK